MLQQQQQQQHPKAHAWEYDVQTITTTVLTTTGGTLWTAATRCREFLEASAEELGLTQPGVKVLELGAGCGTLGLTLARNLPLAGEVCLTEQAYGGALAHLRRNVAANAHLPHMGCVTCCACDWTHFTDPAVLAAAAAAAEAAAATACASSSGQGPGAQAAAQQQQQVQEAHSAEASSSAEGPPDSSSSGPSQQELLDLHKLVSTPWDLIIGSDLIYNASGAHALPQVLARLMGVQQQQQQQQQQPQPPMPSLRQGPCPQQPSSPECSSHQPQQGSQQSAGCTDSTSMQTQAGHGDQSSRSRMVVGQHCASPAAPVMYYAHTKHRYDNMDVTLFERLEAEGLAVEEVCEAGCELQPPSPPPFSSLFPDMRIAVFKIYKAAS